MYKNHNDTAGFSLIELMFVVAIMGVMIGVAVPVVGAQMERLYVKDCNANQKAIRSAIGRAAAITGKDLKNVAAADVNPYIKGGLSSLRCQARKNPVGTYGLSTGAISPVHNHGANP